MRISDWSSDVCSSDLVEPGLFDKPAFTAGIIGMALFFSAFIGMQLVFTLFLQFGHGFSAGQAGLAGLPLAIGAFVGSGLAGGFLLERIGRSSEGKTTELPQLMRTSYAVFSFEKKK